jgi:hypothetical protein
MHQISVGTDVAHCQVIPLDGSKNALSSLCSLGSVEIWDSQLSLFVIQALDGSLCID